MLAATDGNGIATTTPVSGAAKENPTIMYMKDRPTHSNFVTLPNHFVDGGEHYGTGNIHRNSADVWRSVGEDNHLDRR